MYCEVKEIRKKRYTICRLSADKGAGSSGSTAERHGEDDIKNPDKDIENL